MSHTTAVLTAIAGPNEGDTVRLEAGTCRLIGRHLSETETTLIDPDGNRLLNRQAADILADKLKGRTPASVTASAAKPGGLPPSELSVAAFERGPDIIFADDSISRAHAMLFHDEQGVGIVDLASPNGTFVNGQRVGSALVGDADVITIGQSSPALRTR